MWVGFKLIAVAGVALLLVWSTCLMHPDAAPNPLQGNQSETPPEVIPQIGSAAFSGSDLTWLVARRKGYLLHSSNGGASWRRLPASQITKSSQISFVDSEHGWAVAGDSDSQGHIWRSIDGGRTWSWLAKLNSDNPRWRFTGEVQLDFVDRLNGWLIETFSIWRTSDGGISWKQVFSTGQMGGQVFKTTDGGKTWDVQTVRDKGYFTNIFFVDRNTGWLCSGDQMYRTDDGGRTWRLQATLTESWQLESCFFVSKREGWVVGTRLLGPSTGLPETNMRNNLVRGIVLHTLDGGETWMVVRIGQNEPFFHRVHFSSTQTGWLFSRDRVYRTINAGRTWRVVLNLPAIKA